MKNFADLTEREVLAVAISSEEEDSRIYMTFAEDLAGATRIRRRYSRRWPRRNGPSPPAAGTVRAALRPASAADPPRQRPGIFAPPSDLADQEPVARHHPQGSRDHGVRGRAVLRQGGRAGPGCRRPPAARRSRGGGERPRKTSPTKLTDQILSPDVRADEDKTRRRMFVLQYVQPGLAGLMDGSVSTLAPLFAAAFATHQNWQTFLVGLAASIGAGISMGFAEALSDDGSLTGRGSPWLRGAASGIMTALGGLGHTMPYLVPDSWAERVLDRDRDRRRRGVLRIVGDRLYPLALHGHAVPAGGVPDRARRRHRARGRHSDRRSLASSRLYRR